MKKIPKSKDVDKIFKELVSKQKKDVSSNKKLQLSDIKRIAKRISGSITDPNECSIWNGYITNMNNAAKGTYVNFYFRKRKVALHRLLYINFIGELDDDEYLKFTCENKGKCCNVHHMNKYKYNTVENKGELYEECIDGEQKNGSNELNEINKKNRTSNKLNKKNNNSNKKVCYDSDNSETSCNSQKFTLTFD